jgi:tRNA modification GTPase
VQDTIAAISTPFGEGAIAVLRVSGPASLDIASKCFRGKVGVDRMHPRRQYFGRFVDEGENPIDDVLLTFFPAPASYTGEDLVEIGCHGGILVTRRVLQRLLDAGARSAEPGEFTQRAFMNGKMDLTQAEAVMDLITAQTDLALRAANEQLEGRLGNKIRECREQLLNLLAHVEAYIDFPEEDIRTETGRELLATLERVEESAKSLLGTAEQGRILRHGVRTVICGEPNVGKSSLLNLLLGFERAIVSEIPGTTRDTIEEVINLKGIPLRLIDTAGLRESEDVIEKAGMERTRIHIERADLVLHLVDCSRCRNEGDGERNNELLILNKSDLREHPSWSAIPGVRISCREELGLNALADAIFDRVMGGTQFSGDAASIAINARHKACLQSALKYCAAARETLLEGLSAEFIAIEVREALDAIGDVVGPADTEELLGKIFSTFCIGK